MREYTSDHACKFQSVAVVGSVQQFPNRGRFSFILLLLGAHDFKLVAWGVCDFED